MYSLVARLPLSDLTVASDSRRPLWARIGCAPSIFRARGRSSPSPIPSVAGAEHALDQAADAVGAGEALLFTGLDALDDPTQPPGVIAARADDEGHDHARGLVRHATNIARRRDGGVIAA